MLQGRLNVPEIDAAIDVKWGRFLAGDRGVRVAVSKFVRGVTLSAWYSHTGTGVFTDPFNRGYHDKGISVEIPIRLFTGRDSKTAYRYSLSPWTRDVAQDIDRYLPLFDRIGRNAGVLLDKDQGIDVSCSEMIPAFEKWEGLPCAESVSGRQVKSVVAILCAACFLTMSLGSVSRAVAAEAWETWPKKTAEPGAPLHGKRRRGQGRRCGGKENGDRHLRRNDRLDRPREPPASSPSRSRRAVAAARVSSTGLQSVKRTARSRRFLAVPLLPSSSRRSSSCGSRRRSSWLPRPGRLPRRPSRRPRDPCPRRIALPVDEGPRLPGDLRRAQREIPGDDRRGDVVRPGRRRKAGAPGEAVLRRRPSRPAKTRLPAPKRSAAISSRAGRSRAITGTPSFAASTRTPPWSTAAGRSAPWGRIARRSSSPTMARTIRRR